MVLITIKRFDVYNARDFLIKKSDYEEMKNVFKEHLEKLFENETIKNYEEELIEAITEHLNSIGWSDQEIIEEVLKKREQKYIINYIPENHAQEDYFEIIEVEV